MTRVGEEIKRLREDRGWSQPQLAVAAGIAVSAVSQIENGRRSPNVSTIDKLAEAFGVEVSDLFPKVGPPSLFQADEEAAATAIEEAQAWAGAYAGFGNRLAERWEREYDEWAEVLRQDFYSGRNKIVGWKRKAAFLAWYAAYLAAGADYIRLQQHGGAREAEGPRADPEVLLASLRLLALMDKSLGEVDKVLDYARADDGDRDTADRKFWKMAREEMRRTEHVLERARSHVAAKGA